MASLITRLPQTWCLSCLSRTLTSDIFPPLYPSHTQIRGKKRTAKAPSTINVKLLKDVVGYGRKGSIVPVAPGLFRNSWLPRRRAEYISMSTMQGVKPKEVAAERDFGFGVEAKEEGTEGVVAKVEEDSGRRWGNVMAGTRVVAPERASELLDEILPSQIIFYRVPIADPKSAASVPKAEPTGHTSAAAAALAAASSPLAPPPKFEAEKIFGSVSAADMVESIKTLLAEDEESAMVVVGSEDIRIVGDVGEDAGVEGDRLKAIGDFLIEIRVKGGKPVQRTVSVRAQEAASGDV